MANRIFADLLFQQTWRRLGILAALLTVLAGMACAAATPTPSPTATARPPAATVALAATPMMPPSTVPSTAAPSPAPTAPDELAVASEETFSLLEELLAELGHRESATAQELRAAEHLEVRFEEMGYAAEIQPFTFQHFDFAHWASYSGRENAMAVVESPVEMKLPGLLLTTTPNGRMNSGPLTPVDLDGKNGLAKGELDGKIALIQPGGIRLDDLQSLQDQVNEVAAAGAAAALISGTWIGGQGYQGYRPLLAAESAIPALLFLQQIGEVLDELLAEGEVILSVKIDTQELESRNVVAELKGSGDAVVIVGAHYDIVPQTVAGANDNGSGTAIVLSLAEALAGRPLPFTVRFISFGAEELGLYGSSHYVASLSEPERSRIKAMLNFDVVGTGPWLAVSGPQELTGKALYLAAALGVYAQIGSLPPGASSDHAAFERVGVPTLLFFSPDISRIHTPEDRLEFVRPELLGGAFLVAEALLQSPGFAR